jgi:hypothetical protein
VSRGYLEATPDIKPSIGVYSPSQDISITAVRGPRGSFFFAHKIEFRDRNAVSYTLTLPTSKGQMTIPQLGGTLTMPGRDTRIHVTDYELGGNMALVYCTAEIFTWQQYHDRTVLVLYGEAGETHELLFKRDPSNMTIATSSDVQTKEDGKYLYAQWKIGAVNDQFIRAGNLHILLLGKSRLLTGGHNQLN